MFLKLIRDASLYESGIKPPWYESLRLGYFWWYCGHDCWCVYVCFYPRIINLRVLAHLKGIPTLSIRLAVNLSVNKPHLHPHPIFRTRSLSHWHGAAASEQTMPRSNRYPFIAWKMGKILFILRLWRHMVGFLFFSFSPRKNPRRKSRVVKTHYITFIFQELPLKTI